MISLINSPSLERYTKGWELFAHANISVPRVFVFLRLVFMYVCWCSHILRCFSPSHNLHDLSALHLLSTALKSQMKKPRCHLRPTHSFKCVSLSRHNGCCYFSLSLSFLQILVQQNFFFNNAQNVFLGHKGLSQSSIVMPFEK